jgi:hypothetical protein
MMMNSFYQAKFDELFTEFTRYLAEHPIAERIRRTPKLYCSTRTILMQPVRDRLSKRSSDGRRT